MELHPKTARGTDDRLSSLPDDLLLSILRELPLKHAVRTSALSRRWAHLWRHALASATVLDFGGDDFACGQSPAQLVATVNRYLQLHGGAGVDAFRVVFSPFEEFTRDVVGWVAAAIAKGAAEVEVDLSQGVLDTDRGVFVDGRAALELPGDLFQVKNSLTRLSLCRCKLPDPLDTGGFDGLSCLSLSHVSVSDETISGLVRGCRALEFLSLKSCHHLTSVKVAGERLRGLELVSCLGVRAVEVAAPTLKSIAFHGDVCYSSDLGGAPALRDAYVSLIGVGDYGDYEEGYVGLLSGVVHAKVLTVCSVGLMHIEYEQHYNDGLLIEMPNLQELQVLMDSMTDEDLSSIFTFFSLSTSPFLDRLFLRLSGELEDTVDTSDVTAAVTDQAPDIVFSHLTFIKAVNFRGMRSELRLLKFLLERAPVLESLVLVTPEEDDDNVEDREQQQDERLHLKILRGQVSVMRKASTEVQVTVCRPSEDGSRNPAHMRFYHEKYLSGAVSSLNIAPTPISRS